MSVSTAIPICPRCMVPTRRMLQGEAATAVYYPPIYDETGRNTNADRNRITQRWECLRCGHIYVVEKQP